VNIDYRYDMEIGRKDKYYYTKIKKFTRILKEFPENTHVLKQRALCRFWHADWKRAAKDCVQFLQSHPLDVEMWRLLGRTYVHGRLPEQAVSALSRAIELDPDSGHLYMYRGHAYRQLKQWDASIANYTKAMELNQKNRGSRHSTLYRALLYMEMGLYEKAVEDCALAISKTGWYWGAFYILSGEAYIKMKQYEKVLENSNAFTDSCGDPWQPLLKQCSYAHKKLGQREKAKEDLALIKRLDDKERQVAEDAKKSDGNE